jgi:DNA-binding NtrC family response regulator
MKRTPPAAAQAAKGLDGLPDWFLDREVIPLDDQLALVVSHAAMRGIVALCRGIAEQPRPVLLTGETGVGKSLLARFLHASRDPYAPFASMLAAGLGEEVIEARLFGESGLVGQTAGGTLLLDEMGDLPHASQMRLLRCWDQGRGGPGLWICTTNADCQGLAPEFLKRLRRIDVPPLRERKEDIPALVAYFARLRTSRRESLKGLKDLAARLATHHFPGNVRELESLMALETSGLPWRWRVCGPERSCSLRAK